MKASPILLVLGTTLLPACGNKNPTFEEMVEIQRKELAPLVDQHRAAGGAMITALRTAAAEARSTTKVAKREPLPAPVVIANDDLVAAHLLLANIEWLANERWVNEAQIQIRPEVPIERLDQLLTTGLYDRTGNHDAPIVEQALTQLTSLQHVAFVRVHEYQPPKLAEGNRFEGGVAEGDVLVFALPAHAREGAFPFEARQGETAKVARRSAEADLRGTFDDEVRRTIRAELVAFLANRPGPAAPGAAAAAEQAGFRDRIQMALAEAMVLGIKDVALENSLGGPIVTLYAESPATIAPQGTVRSDVTALVTKILGRGAEIRVVAATPR